MLKKLGEVTDGEWNMLLKSVIVDNAKKEYKIHFQIPYPKINGSS